MILFSSNPVTTVIDVTFEFKILIADFRTSGIPSTFSNNLLLRPILSDRPAASKTAWISLPTVIHNS